MRWLSSHQLVVLVETAHFTRPKSGYGERDWAGSSRRVDALPPAAAMRAWGSGDGNAPS
ncbi:MAG: hypothetical protein QM582_07095 [Micropruina sp.]|uniref:hypothetical protein n=1 Tax=Micropruina sp. TaxID=2737536 RepID=UPI0039E59DF6